MQNKNIRVYLAAFLYAIITGLSFAATKIALKYNNPTNILAHRFLFAFIALFITLLANKKLSFFKKQSFKTIFPLALVYPLLFFGFQTFGLKYVDSSIGGILLSTAPIFTLILSRLFLKQKAGFLKIFFVLLAVSSVIFIFYMTAKNASKVNLLGVILLLLATLSSAVYSIITKHYTNQFENLEILTVMISTGLIGFNLLALINNFINKDGLNYFVSLFNYKYLLSLSYLGILSTLLTSQLTNFILRHLEPAKMIVFSCLGTLISIVAGAFILNENIYYYHYIGAVFIIIGIIGTNFAKTKN